MSNVTLKAVRKAFGPVEIIRGVDLDIHHGEFIVFVGPSGCGKSTLLRMIAGLEDISSGDLFIGDLRANQLAPAKRGVAMVFQSYALYPHMSVYENMAFGLSLAKQGEQEIRAAVTKAAEILQLSHLLERKPRELSGGQRQRVAIGRAIVRSPGVFLFDEPLSNLDAALRVQMRIEIARLHADLGATMIYVTHDQVEAMTLADRIVVLNRGNVEQAGSPLELYHRPRNRFVAGFIGSPKMNFVSARISEINPHAILIALPGGSSARVEVLPGSAAVGDEVTLGIRPEHLVLAGNDSSASLRGEVQVIERLGDETYAYLEVAGAEEGYLTLRLDPRTPVAVGQSVPLTVPADLAQLFGKDGLAFDHPPGRDEHLAAAGAPRASAHHH